MSARLNAHIRQTCNGAVVLERAVPADSISQRVRTFCALAGTRHVSVSNPPGQACYIYRDLHGAEHVLLVTLPRCW
jgi:hypothetical protein